MPLFCDAAAQKSECFCFPAKGREVFGRSGDPDRLQSVSVGVNDGSQSIVYLVGDSSNFGSHGSAVDSQPLLTVTLGLEPRLVYV